MRMRTSENHSARWRLQRLVGFVVGFMLVLAVVVGLTFRPTPRTQIQDFEGAAPIALGITLDSFDPVKGIISVSVQAAADTSAIDGRGITVFTDISGVEQIHLPESNFAAPETGEIRVDSADLVSYPFDEYDIDVTAAAYVGEPTLSLNADPSDLGEQVPIDIQVVSMLGTFRADASVSETAGVPTVEVDLYRPKTTRVWASAMMAIYWGLAIAAVAVVVATMAGLLLFETRHLAWLTAMIFAFAAFRNTAPGSPPIGVFIDFAAFFWAVGLVVLAELLLLAYYLFGQHDGSLTPAEDDDGPTTATDDHPTASTA